MNMRGWEKGIIPEGKEEPKRQGKWDHFLR
jgi:hypothetical protein